MFGKSGSDAFDMGQSRKAGNSWSTAEAQSSRGKAEEDKSFGNKLSEADSRRERTLPDRSY